MGIHNAGICALACLALRALGQQCPQESSTGPTTPSEVRVLDGKLVFHDGIRKWFELRLDEPQCGQTSIQLIRVEGDWTSLEVLRGCHVRSIGAIDFSPTGYYSLNTFQNVERIEPTGICSRQPPFPDYSKMNPDRSIRAYRVSMHIAYGQGDSPINIRVSSAGKALRPWQAYARYTLTGGFVFYGFCAEGFVIDKVSGTPQANPSQFDDMAALDPEAAAAAGKKSLHLGYTCARNQ